MSKFGIEEIAGAVFFTTMFAAFMWCVGWITAFIAHGLFR